MAEVAKRFLWVSTQWKLRQSFPAPCQYCRSSMSLSEATVDHVTPLSKGGIDDETNYVLACEACNSAKGDMLPLEFMVSPRRDEIERARAARFRRKAAREARRRQYEAWSRYVVELNRRNGLYAAQREAMA